MPPTGRAALAALAALAVLCAPTARARDTVRFGGSVSTTFNLRLFGCTTPDTCRFLNFRNTNVVALRVDARPSRSTQLRAHVALRNVNFAEIETLDDAGDVSKVQPVDVRLYETRVDLFDLFGLKGLDISAGALRLAWGTGDGLSPVDRINPYDLEDGTGFDRRLVSPAIQLAYAVGPVTFEVAWIPLFTAGLLPVDEIDFTTLGDTQGILGIQSSAGSDPPEIHKVETPTTTPDITAENMQVAARVRWASPIGDLSLLFFRGFESLPQASGEARLTGFQTTNRVDLGVPLLYPRIMMAGFAYRGPLVDRLSAWAEVAVLFPEAHAVTASRNQLEQLVKLGRLSAVPDPLPRQVTQSDAVYVHAVAGLEYVLGMGEKAGELHLSAQYARGLPTERQAGDIHDYALLSLRWAVLGGRLIFAAQGAIEVAGPETLGFQAGGAVSWLHGDAARLTLAAGFQGGQPGTTFRRFETLSNLRLSFHLAF